MPSIVSCNNDNFVVTMKRVTYSSATPTSWYYFLLWFMMTVLITRAFEETVIYVVEPFEKGFDMNLTSDPLAELQFFTREKKSTRNNHTIQFAEGAPYSGNGSMRFDFDFHNDNNQDDYNLLYTVQGMAPGKRIYNCYGATSIGFVYRLQGVNRLKWRLTLFDGTDCIGCNMENELESWYYEGGQQQDLEGNLDTWVEILLPIPNGWKHLAGPGNGQLDVQHIKIWRLEFWYPSITDDVAIPKDTGSGRFLLLDHFHFRGSGEMFSAPFYSDSFDLALAVDEIATSFQGSELGENRTGREFNGDGSLWFNYTIEQLKPWGGGITQTYLLPGRAYFNLSQSEAIYFDWRIIESANHQDRVHLRLYLSDASHCVENCWGRASENYYSFHWILDEAAGSEGNVTMELNSTMEESKFILTGWYGELGNEVMNKDMIKGYTFGIQINRDGDVGSNVSGIFEISHLVAIGSYEAVQQSHHCEVEPGLQLLGDKGSHGLRMYPEDKITFGECCDLCESDPSCVYGMYASWKRCYYTTDIRPGQTILREDAEWDSWVQVFWKNTPEVRGAFCDECDCNGFTRTIDCRGKDLTVVPMSFADQDWTPEILDLRNNSRLTVLFTGCLDELAHGLKELRLPSNVDYLSEHILTNLTSLETVLFGERDLDNEMSSEDLLSARGSPLINAISHHNDVFSNVCCGLGSKISLGGWPAPELTFCDFQVDDVGSDVIYEEFVEYFDPEYLVATKTIQSHFMHEAGESVEKCAEYCKVQPNCLYFSFDSRPSLAAPRCRHMNDPGTPEFRNTSFADAEKKLPGYVSGRIPRTRHLIDNARLLVTSAQLEANNSNSYTAQFDLSLGSLPLRGGVWITPQIVSKSVTKMEVDITPAFLVLYDNTTTISVEIRVLNVENLPQGGSILFKHAVETCDQAFRPSNGHDPTFQIKITRVLENSSLFFFVVLVVSLTFASMLVTSLLYMYRHRTHELMKMAQVPFLAVIVVCGTILVGAFFLYLPSSNVGCRFLPLVSQVFMGILAATLVGRLWRTYTVLKVALQMGRDFKPPKGEWVMEFLTSLAKFHKLCSKQGAEQRRHFRVSLRKQVSNLDVLRLVIVLSLPQLIVQIIGFIFFPCGLTVDFEIGGFVSRQTCDLDGFLWFGMAYNLFLFFLSVFAAWLGRDLPSLLNEKDAVFQAGSISVFLTFMLIIGYILTAEPSTSPDVISTLWLIQVDGTVAAVVCFLVWPKLWRIRSGGKVVVSNLLKDRTSVSSDAGVTDRMSYAPSSNNFTSMNTFSLGSPGNTNSFVKPGPKKYDSVVCVNLEKGDAPPKTIEFQMLQLKDLLMRLCGKTLSGKLISLENWKRLKHDVSRFDRHLKDVHFRWGPEDEIKEDYEDEDGAPASEDEN